MTTGPDARSAGAPAPHAPATDADLARLYPATDEEMMPLSDTGRAEMWRLWTTLDAAFATDPDVYVSSDLFIYYREGDPSARVAPDVFVVRGVPKLPRRRVYFLWREGVVPCFALEIASVDTWRRDLVEKRTLYASLGVSEYVRYDPEGVGMPEPLVGERLVGGRYRPMAVDAEGALLSDALGLRLHLVAGLLEVFDRQTGAHLLDPARALDAQAAALRAEAAARRAAEAEVARLRALLEGRPPAT